MIKKAQIRFIAITMAIVFAFMAAIFTVIAVINKNDTDHVAYERLLDAEREYQSQIPVKGGNSVSVIEVSFYDSSSGYGNYDVVKGENFITEEDVNSIVSFAMKNQDGNGKFSSFYYRKTAKNALTVIYVADLKMEAERFSSTMLKTFITFAVTFILLFALTTALSFKVVEPIKRIFAKQKQFISDASHELKTPVAIISANADVIKAQGENVYADSIKKQVDRLKFLVNDLLTLAKMDEGSVKTYTEKFNLSEETLQTALPFDAVAFEKGKTLYLDIEKGIEKETDKNGFKQILNILLDNAVKYADNGGNIKVSLKKSGGAAILSVYNDGSNIKKEDSLKIFERFFRGDNSRSRESGGNGLGLSIAKSIAVANKWQLTADSDYLKSMTITLTI